MRVAGRQRVERQADHESLRPDAREIADLHQLLVVIVALLANQAFRRQTCSGGAIRINAMRNENQTYENPQTKYKYPFVQFARDVTVSQGKVHD